MRKIKKIKTEVKIRLNFSELNSIKYALLLDEKEYNSVKMYREGKEINNLHKKIDKFINDDSTLFFELIKLK